MKQLYKNVLLWAVILVMFVAFYQFFNSHEVRGPLKTGGCEPLIVNGRCEEPDKCIQAVRGKWGRTLSSSLAVAMVCEYRSPELLMRPGKISSS